MHELLLFGGGMDSFPAWHYLGRPAALYVDLGHRYRTQELATVKALTKQAGMQVEISHELNLAAWEAPDAIIPMRNIHLAMLAANRGAETIWCVGVKGDATADKSPAAFADISAFLSRYANHPVTVDSPFWRWTKTEIVRWYLAEGLPVDDLLLTFSCSRADDLSLHCGQCSSCLRRWISLVNNGIDAPFESPPWQWARIESYYLTAMRDGTYPPHRAEEFFAALATVGLPTPQLPAYGGAP